MGFKFSHRTYANSIVLIAAALMFFVLKSASHILLPMITAGFIYVAFYPYMEALRGKGMHLWAIAVVSEAMLILFLTVFLVVFIYTADMMISTITDYVGMADDLLDKLLSYFSERFDVIPARREANMLLGLSEYAITYLRSNFSYLRGTLSPLILILVYDFFFFIDHDKIRRMVGRRITKRRTLVAIELTIRQTSRYIGAKLLASALTAAVFLAIMAFYNMRGALVLTILVFMFNFVPTIGSIISTMVVCALAFLQFGVSGSLSTAVLVSALCVLTQFVIGNILDPYLVGKRVRLSPLVALFSLTLWGVCLRSNGDGSGCSYFLRDKKLLQIWGMFSR